MCSGLDISHLAPMEILKNPQNEMQQMHFSKTAHVNPGIAATGDYCRYLIVWMVFILLRVFQVSQCARYPQAAHWNGNPMPDPDPDPNAKLMLTGG